MNNVYYNISRDGGEIIESPIIPIPQGQNHTRTQRPHKPSGLRGLEADLWKSKAPTMGTAPLVPQPLFSSGNRATEAGVGQAVAPAKSATPSVATTANPTPVSPLPSPSLFPIPPSSDAIVASPASLVSPLSIHHSNSLSRSSVYSQNTVSNMTTSTRTPRPTSSIYSQNTMGNMAGAPRPPAAAPASPRTPTMTDWASVLPGLPNSAPVPTPRGSVVPPQQVHPQVLEAIHPAKQPEPSNQHIQVQIQVPRLRSPSIPQDRGSRRATLTNPAAMQVHAHGRTNSTQRVQSPETASYLNMSAVAAAAAAVIPDHEGQDWPLQKPSVAHNAPDKRKHYVHRSRGSGSGFGTTPEPPFKHTANKASVSSSFTHVEPADQYITSPRASMADSHTPMYGPGEQRSGWWSDDEDEEQGHAGGASLAAREMMKEKQGTEARRRVRRKIKIIVGVSAGVVVVIAGVAVAVALTVGK
ncbi:hypothetical protein F4861DRAFT_529203 [Xylaria intraflava]|nr:hypothetical protein F4861DRAFT_529203 [Xylaria intraflava]